MPDHPHWQLEGTAPELYQRYLVPSRMASIAPTAFIPKESWATSEAIVLEAGILKQSVSYDQVIDMQFVNEVRKELNVQ